MWVDGEAVAKKETKISELDRASERKPGESAKNGSERDCSLSEMA